MDSTARFDTIITHHLVAWSDVNGDAGIRNRSPGAPTRAGLLRPCATAPAPDRVRLSPEDWERLVTWIDANAPYHDHFVNKRAAGRL